SEAATARRDLARVVPRDLERIDRGRGEIVLLRVAAELPNVAHDLVQSEGIGCESPDRGVQHPAVLELGPLVRLEPVHDGALRGLVREVRPAVEPPPPAPGPPAPLPPPPPAPPP